MPLKAVLFDVGLTLTKTIPFPEIYRKIYLNIADKTRTEETLIEIFTKFVTRWGYVLDSFSEEHKSYLTQLTDQTIAENNSYKSEALVGEAKSPNDAVMPNFKQIRLSDEILKAVEQELLIQAS